MNLCSYEVIGNYPVFLQAMPDPGVGTYALLPLTLLPIAGYAQLACLIQAANVRSEPGSNPSKVFARTSRRSGDPKLSGI